MKPIVLMTLAVGSLLAACSKQYADNQRHEKNAYAGLEYQSVTIIDQKWLLKDNVESRSFILASSLEEMYGDFGREVVTHTLAKDRGVTLDKFRPAAEAYAASKHCKVVSGRMMQRHQSEFQYSC